MSERKPDFRIEYVYTRRDGQWFWRLVSVHNGQIVATPHEKYTELSHAVHMAESIFTPDRVVFPADGEYITAV